jgi:uncharacterized protein YndB with AHSA1/START domain
MTESTKATPRITGTLHSLGGKGVVRMESHYDTDINDLWQALSDTRRLARWLADVQGDLRVGGKFHATFTSGWDGVGRIDLCEPPHRLMVSMWDERENETVVAAELIADGDQTKLTIEERGIPLDELAAHGAGWHAHVEEILGPS